MPPPPVQFTFRLKRASLTAAMQRVERATGKLPSLITNKAVFSIANRARKAMPVASDGKIREVLQESKAHELVKLKSGRFSKAKKNVRSFFNGEGDDAPLLALIVQSRANPGYTGPYKLPHSPWKGVKRAEGAARMLETMRKVFNSRIRSIGFFRAEAQGIMLIFRQVVYSLKGPALAAGKILKRRGNLFDATVATGKGRATATWWVRSTEPDARSNRNALRTVAEPVWQRAMDDEARSLNAYAIKKEYTDALRAAGCTVK